MHAILRKHVYQPMVNRNGKILPQRKTSAHKHTTHNKWIQLEISNIQSDCK